MKNMEQELAALRDSLPHACWAMYSGCLTAGFNTAQAFQLTVAFLGGMVMRPSSHPGGNEEEE